MNYAKIIISSFFITLIIFIGGLALNYGFDFLRLNALDSLLKNQELNTEAYLAESVFFSTFNADSCGILNATIPDLQESLSEVGRDLASYSSISWFNRKDFDYLKRKYFLLEARLFLLLSRLNRECHKNYVPVLFFYEVDDLISERQGFILDELVNKLNERVVVISIDKDYVDEPIIILLKDKYNVTSAPTIIIDGLKFDHLMYFHELNESIAGILNRPDIYSKDYSFDYTVSAAGVNRTLLFKELEASFVSSSSNFTKGDVLLVEGRLLKNNSLLCSSIPYYFASLGENREQDALVFEAIGSLSCTPDSRLFYLNASRVWNELGNYFRADLLKNLSLNRQFTLQFNIAQITPMLDFYGNNFSGILIGNSSFSINNDDKIVSQTDRVFRDWLSGQMNQSPFGLNLLKTFSERLRYSDEELLPEIGWHEGGRLMDIGDHINVSLIPAVGTLVAKYNHSWYAVDDRGVFRFEVPLDKLLYPTTRFLRNDLAVIIDTHGVNMLVEQAVRNNADFILSDCDHPGKVLAAQYLSQKGIKVVCFPDRFVFLALGNNLSLVGSPPLGFEKNQVVVGNRPLFLAKSNKIIVLNASVDKYALWYYQTPAQYFSELENYVKLNATYVAIDDFNQLSRLIAEAGVHNANFVAARVFNSDDYSVLKNWLLEDKNHKAILFHTSSYPYGFKLFSEFPEQTSFDDPNVIVVK